MPDHDAVTVRRERLDSTAAQALIAALNAELSAQYPEPGANHFRLDAEETAEGRGALFVAYVGDRPLGCGAVRRIDAARAEVKRMYVAAEARGRGLGGLILAEVEREARRLGASELVLETGTRQTAAMALYRNRGFKPIPCYGEYASSQLSVCLGKALA